MCLEIEMNYCITYKKPSRVRQFDLAYLRTLIICIIVVLFQHDNVMLNLSQINLESSNNPLEEISTGTLPVFDGA